MKTEFIEVKDGYLIYDYLDCSIPAVLIYFFEGRWTLTFLSVHMQQHFFEFKKKNETHKDPNSLHNTI